MLTQAQRFGILAAGPRSATEALRIQLALEIRRAKRSDGDDVQGREVDIKRDIKPGKPAGEGFGGNSERFGQCDLAAAPFQGAVERASLRRTHQHRRCYVRRLWPVCAAAHVDWRRWGPIPILRTC